MTIGNKKLFEKYALVPLLSILIVHAAVWLGTKAFADISRATDVTLPIDAMIPLRSEWVLIYILTFVFWAMGLLMIARQSEELCCRFTAGIIFAELFCCFIFIAFPSCVTRPELDGSDVFTWILSIIYTADTPTNCFPSMHCLFSYLVFRQSLKVPDAKPWFKIFCGVFAVLVFLSTLFVKQHVIADVFGGVFFAELSYILGQKTSFWKLFAKMSKKCLRSGS
jgi:membrane-associated phospholipid phosphatase